MKHSNGGCEKCKEFLTQLNKELASYASDILARFPDCHISCAFRGEAEQNQAFKNGKSRLKWPNSKHNVMKDGLPCSEAIDLFQLSDLGTAIFNRDYYKTIFNFIKENQLPIAWGGLWVTFKDNPHFELK